MSITLGGCPTLAPLIGSSVGSSSLLSSINAELKGSNFFNSVEDILSEGRRMFITNIVQPIREVGHTLANLITTMDQQDKILPIITEEQLRNIPPCMYDPILQYQPIRKLFDEGRIFGFGCDFIPEGDPYGRLIRNGVIENVQEAMDKDGNITFEWEFVSTDPDLSFEEIDSIEETRLYLDKILADTKFDPTDYPNDRG